MRVFEWIFKNIIMNVLTGHDCWQVAAMAGVGNRAQDCEQVEVHISE